MSNEAKSSSLTVHANQDVISIPANVVEKFPFFQKHIEKNGHGVPMKLEMSAIELIQVLEPELDVLPQEKKTEHEKKLWGFSNLIGKWVDARDSNDNWHHAKIIAATGKKIQITYPGYAAKWDEWLPIPSDRLRAFGSCGELASAMGQFVFPKLGEDIGHGRVWSENFQFSVSVNDWM